MTLNLISHLSRQMFDVWSNIYTLIAKVSIENVNISVKYVF